MGTESRSNYQGSDERRAHEAAGSSADGERIEDAPSTETFSEAFPTTAIPKNVGHYHVKRLIATGGMGTVYEAVQERPRRPVALKVMRRGITAKSALRRFERESQLLARLRHPGIAQVYEAGTHDDISGPVPYFAMEYIPNAKPITDYANDKKLDTRDRLRLFIPVCEAVHHGHQKGIIHRDLKPGNILVDGRGQVKIIDFGVARSTDSDMTITTLQTAVGQLVGTLRYMSPEQCEADPHSVDARSDVYSLGVVLYEMLSGRAPYDLEQERIFEVTRVIREVPPAPLSGTDATLRGDLETIVTKALEKDPQRRYPSATEMAEDIKRYLGNEPIIARRPSAFYRMGKLAQKRKVPIILTAIVLSLLAITVLSHIKASRALLAAALETANTLSLEALIMESARAMDRDQTNEVIRVLTGMIEADPLNREALWARAWHHHQVGNRKAMLADAERLTSHWPETARYWSAKAFALARLNRLKEAITCYDQALALRPDDARALVNRAETQLRIGNIPMALVDCGKAIALDDNLTMAYALRAKLRAMQRAFGQAQQDCARALALAPTNSLALRVSGQLYLERGKFQEALDAYNQGMQGGQGQPEDFHNRARLHRLTGDYKRALADHDTATARAPSVGLVFLARSITRRFAGDPEGALADLSHAISVDPGSRLQACQWTWEIRMLRGEAGDREAAEAALALAEDATTDTFERMMIGVCRGRDLPPEALTDASSDLLCAAYYYLGARALVEEKRTDAEAWFRKCRDTNAHTQPEYDLAGWHLQHDGVD